MVSSFKDIIKIYVQKQYENLCILDINFTLPYILGPLSPINYKGLTLGLVLHQLF